MRKERLCGEAFAPAGFAYYHHIAVDALAIPLEEVYEPFLIQEGYLMRTPRGREVTDLAYRHLGRKRQSEQGFLF